MSSPVLKPRPRAGQGLWFFHRLPRYQSLWFSTRPMTCFLCNHNASVKSLCPEALKDSWRSAADYLWTSGRWPTARRCQWRRWCLYRGRWPLKGWRAELWWAWASSGHKFLNSVCLVSMTPPTRRMRERQTQKSVRHQQRSTTVTLSALVLEVFFSFFFYQRIHFYT